LVILQTNIDHLVVAARSLAEGTAWCEATLGITPQVGGEHEQFGTHNCLFKIATPRYPTAYFEIIAINPDASAQKLSANKRWFDLDDDGLQASIAQHPALIHFVVGTTDIEFASNNWKAQGLDVGPVVHAQRQTNKGLLNWQITVRNDGQRLFDGTLPTLIQWGKPNESEPMRLHPSNSLPQSGVSLQSVTVSHPASDKLICAYKAVHLRDIEMTSGEANISAHLQTPKGLVVLQSRGLQQHLKQRPSSKDV
jgi:hypothetical protein